MSVSNQVYIFLGFVVIGIVIAVIFDFFRCYRKIKKCSELSVLIQDIIYFVLVAVIIMLGIIYILNSSFRFYIFLAIIIGCMIHIGFFSKYMMKIYEVFFMTLKTFFSFILVPLQLNIEIGKKIWSILRKMIKKCCKLFSYMVSYLRKLLKSGKNKLPKKKKIKKQKRVKNEKKNPK